MGQGRIARDKAVEFFFFRNAGYTAGDKKVWAAQDRTVPDRAARNYCLGLKRLLKDEWQIGYTITVSEEAPYVVTVGGEHALTAKIVNHSVDYQWQGEWLTWVELHSHTK